MGCKQCSASFCLRIFSGFDVCFGKLPFVLGFCHSIIAILICVLMYTQVLGGLCIGACTICVPPGGAWVGSASWQVFLPNRWVGLPRGAGGQTGGWFVNGGVNFKMHLFTHMFKNPKAAHPSLCLCLVLQPYVRTTK